jgi:hypothetical protein
MSPRAVPDPAAHSGLPAEPPARAAPDSPAVPDSTRMPDQQSHPEPATRDESTATCPWCSGSIAAGDERCPSCGATLVDLAASQEEPIPGVTAVAPEYREFERKATVKKPKPSLLSLFAGESERKPVPQAAEPVDPATIAPPSDKVRAAMEQLDRAIAAGGIVYFNPVGGAAAEEATAAEETATAAEAAPRPRPRADPCPLRSIQRLARDRSRRSPAVPRTLVPAGAAAEPGGRPRGRHEPSPDHGRWLVGVVAVVRARRLP